MSAAPSSLVPARFLAMRLQCGAVETLAPGLRDRAGRGERGRRARGAAAVVMTRDGGLLLHARCPGLSSRPLSLCRRLWLCSARPPLGSRAGSVLFPWPCSSPLGCGYSPRPYAHPFPHSEASRRGRSEKSASEWGHACGLRGMRRFAAAAGVTRARASVLASRYAPVIRSSDAAVTTAEPDPAQRVEQPCF